MDNKLMELVETYNAENEKFERGNGAAGTRARKALMEIKKYTDERRKQIQEIKNSSKS